MKQILEFMAADIGSSIKKLLIIFASIIAIATFVGLFFLTSEGSMDRYIYWLYYGASIVCFVFPVLMELWLFDETKRKSEAGKEYSAKFLVSRWLLGFFLGLVGGYILFGLLTAITTGNYLNGTNALLWLRPIFISGASAIGMLFSLLFPRIKTASMVLFYAVVMGPSWLIFMIDITLRSRISGSSNLRNTITILWLFAAVYSVVWSIIMSKNSIKFSGKEKLKK